MTASELRELERLLSDFAWFADRGDGRSLAELFLEDAVLHVGGQQHHGRESIAADCYRRASEPGRKVRHVWSNLRVQDETDGRINTAAIQLTFEQTEAHAKTQLRVNDLLDQFAKGPEGTWRFARRVISRAMAVDI
ncbi:MAG: ring hydroxylating beta subunit [Ramlibacter sp.]|nr:ring hydroxylating beta subunit [Ramlibacter sp.]